ncbi:MAG: SIR2 family protein [Promethearchaeota archaeon]
MKPINLQIKDLINDKEKLTFLVGAGCSIDSPSCLPAGRAMMNAIIDYVCPQSEINKIKNLEQLRFEALVEIVRDTLDNDLKLIDYYGLCEKPNIQHFFFAEMIKKGHFVMTTNFDFLLEHALLQSGVPKDEIIVAITKEDFVNYQNPVELYENNKKTLYKIHGSTQNIITEKSTKDSLVATIQAFGSNKQGLNMFQIESFKQNLFKNITKDRSLVIIGYSGSDDFDVVPTLKELKNLNNVIWIDFKKDVENQEQIFEIDKSTLDKDKVNQVLIELKQTNNAKHVYRVYANTSRMIRELLPVEPKISPQSFSMHPYDWLQNNIAEPEKFDKYFIADEIYTSFGMFQDALKYKELQLSIAEEEHAELWKARILNGMAALQDIDRKQFDSRKERSTKTNYAMAKYLEALKIYEQLGNLQGKANILCYIADLYYKMPYRSSKLYKRRKQKIQEIYEETLKLDSQIIDPNYFSAKASHLISIARFFNSQKKNETALNMYEQALLIYDQIGYLRGKALVFHEMGGLFYSQWKYDEAKKRYELSLQVLQQLGLGENHPNMRAIKADIELLKLKEKKQEKPFNMVSDEIEEKFIIIPKAKKDFKVFQKTSKIFTQLKSKINEKSFSKLHKELKNYSPEDYIVYYFISYLLTYKPEYQNLKNEAIVDEIKNQVYWKDADTKLNKTIIQEKFFEISEKFFIFLEDSKTDNLKKIQDKFDLLKGTFEVKNIEEKDYFSDHKFFRIFEAICGKELIELCLSIHRAIYAPNSEELNLFKLILDD